MSSNSSRCIARWRPGTVFDLAIVDSHPGLLTFTAEGEGAKQAFANEPGGHRFQRISPTERHGRTHTSTITVVVLDVGDNPNHSIRQTDVEVRPYRGSGAGGQHRNKTFSAIELVHKPTNTVVRCESERSQHQNLRIAWAWLDAKVVKAAQERACNATNDARKVQAGSGQRGDKVRTVRFQDGIVTNNLNGKKMTLDRYLDGDFSKLF